MCEDEEDYGLVRELSLGRPELTSLSPGILGGQQLGAGRGPGEPVLQQQGPKRGRTEGGARLLPEGARPGGRR